MLCKKLIPACLTVMSVFAPACAARRPGTPPQPGFNLFSKQQDVQLGQEAAAQVRQQYDVVQNRELQEYISRVGKKLASQPEAGGYPYSFTLLNDKQVNAFALPGGPTFVFTGLLEAADNEAELAGVLAHEISHVALRHGTNQASKANLIQLPAALAGAALGSGSLLGQLTQLGLGLGVNSLFLKFSRTDESQADALGARIMSEAGYNPIEMAHFFEKLEAQGGSRAPQFLSDHPNPGNRVKAVEAEIRAFPQRNYNADTGELQKEKSLVAQLPPPRKHPQQQAMAQPSASTPASGNASTNGFRQLQAQTFGVAVPSDWQAYGDNNSSSITVAPQNGLVRTANGSVSVGAGAILSYFSPEGGGKSDLRSMTDTLIHHLHAQNPNMQVLGTSRKVRVDGNSGLMTEFTSDSPYGGQGERDILLTVARPEGLFYMVFVAPQDNFNQFQATFNQMLSSLRFRS
jgi:beta-barrel assembly-enhancing protease